MSTAIAPPSSFTPFIERVATKSLPVFGSVIFERPPERLFRSEHRRYRGPVDGTLVLSPSTPCPLPRRPIPRHSADNQSVTGFSPEQRAGPEGCPRPETPVNRLRRPRCLDAAQALSTTAGLGASTAAPGGARPSRSRDPASAVRIARIASGSS